MQNPTIIILADYGIGDPSFAEVLLRLKTLIPEASIYPQSVPAFSTVNTGFWIYQLAVGEKRDGFYIFSNTAPRKEDKNAQEDNQGEKLMYAKLDNGFELMAVNAGYVFSFIKDHIVDFRFVNVENKGSQFRSRDFYPQAIARMVEKDEAVLGEKADIIDIPPYPRNVISSIDGYGNIKTTVRVSEVAHYTPGQRLKITLNHQVHIATYTDGVFNIREGELAFAPGSSGHADRFMELFVRGGNARNLFARPDVETLLEVQE